MLALPEEIQNLIHMIERKGFEAYVVGGPVRDMLMERKPHDWDIATNARPEQVMQLFEKTVPTGLRHGTITVFQNGWTAEVTTYRTESAYLDHRAPQQVRFVQTIAEDLKRRDFTINAMAFHPQRGIIDLFGGKEDIKRGLVRAVGNTKRRFEEDALRMLRAIRFACQLNFTITTDTLEAIKEKAPLLQYISHERMAAELTAALQSKVPQHLNLLYETGMVKFCLPGLLDWERQDWEAALQRVKLVPAEKVARWAALLYNKQLTEPCVRSLLMWLKLDRQTINGVSCIVRHSGFSSPLSLLQLKRFVRSFGDTYLETALWVELAAQEVGCLPLRVTQIMEQYRKMRLRGEPVCVRELAINGTDLQELGMQGKQIGNALNSLLEWVLEHPEQNDKTTLLQWIRHERME